MTIFQLYQDVCHRLAQVGIPDYDSEADILIGHFLHLNRSEIFLQGKELVASSILKKIDEALVRRISSRCPLAYIIGVQDFWGRTFNVSDAVLIPRPETEILIEKVLQVVELKRSDLKFMDLGTGSGIIAITLIHELAGSKGVAVDRSMSALITARDNAKDHGVSGRLAFLNADWYSAVKLESQFDLIVSNPPYVAHDILNDLQPELDHEPTLALDGGQKGMVEIRRLVSNIDKILKPGGWFFMEIGFDQKDYVCELLNSLPDACGCSASLYDNVMVHKDYAGLPRIVQARRSLKT